jgi:DNA-binding response OmpR family regulator
VRSVLIVDDDPVLLGLMSAAFQAGGFKTRTADNGRRAVRMAETAPPDLVVTDIVMPEMEGIATLMELKKLHAPPRVIAISGQPSFRRKSYLKWAKTLGADAVLAKPFRMSEIVGLANKIVADEEQVTGKSGE